MKVQIECPNFRAYLQKKIPAAFDADGLMDTQHEAVKKRNMVSINRVISSLDGIEYFGELWWLYVEDSPEIKHLPRLSNTLRVFWSNHKFETSVQPVFFWDGLNFVMLDDGRIVCGAETWGRFDKFKASVAKREDADKFAPFITECEDYLAKLNPDQSK